MIKIDARGENCPIPVIKTKRVLKEIEKDGTVFIMVDNKIATENLEKMAVEYNNVINIEKINDEHYNVTIIKGNGSIEVNDKIQDYKGNNIVIVIQSDKMGDGDYELGKTLLKGFIYSLTEIEILPKTIIFYNKGAKITTENLESIQDLEKLQSLGTTILTCGACLNFYNLADKLKVGTSTNMYTITNILMNAEKIIRP